MIDVALLPIEKDYYGVVISPRGRCVNIYLGAPIALDYGIWECYFCNNKFDFTNDCGCHCGSCDGLNNKFMNWIAIHYACGRNKNEFLARR